MPAPTPTHGCGWKDDLLNREIRQDLDVIGLANIPNQIHHEERHALHPINIALVGTEGGKPFV